MAMGGKLLLAVYLSFHVGYGAPALDRGAWASSRTAGFHLKKKFPGRVRGRGVVRVRGRYPAVRRDEVALVDEDLKDFIKGFEFDVSDLETYIQPASIDIPVTGKAYLVKEKILPFQRDLKSILPEVVLEEKSLVDSAEGMLLLKGQTYIIYCGKIRLPKGFRGVLSPKSSIGRIDLMVRAIADACGLYDVIPDGSNVDLWMEVSPRSFNVRLHHSQALTQLMILKTISQDINTFSISNPNINHAPLVYDTRGLVENPSLHEGMLVLGIRIPTEPSTLIGYEAMSTAEVVDLKKVDHHSPLSFFRPIYTPSEGEQRGRLVLEKDRFYILCVRERVAVPPSLSGEMIPFSHNIGELRAHYAGFFDPGFGFGESGELEGSTGVLEVRPHETVTIYDGQPICLMRFFQNNRIPKQGYGSSALGSHYQGQAGPWLAKYFKKKKQL